MLLDNRVIEVKFHMDAGTIYGSRYYTVKPEFGGHIDTWFRNEWRAMEDWCTEVMGLPGDIWTYTGRAPEPNLRWYVNNSKFWFRNESDMTMFILRWS